MRVVPGASFRFARASKPKNIETQLVLNDFGRVGSGSEQYLTSRAGTVGEDLGKGEGPSSNPGLCDGFCSV